MRNTKIYGSRSIVVTKIVTIVITTAIVTAIGTNATILTAIVSTTRGTAILWQR